MGRAGSLGVGGKNPLNTRMTLLPQSSSSWLSPDGARELYADDAHSPLLILYIATPSDSPPFFLLVSPSSPPSISSSSPLSYVYYSLYSLPSLYAEPKVDSLCAADLCDVTLSSFPLLTPSPSPTPPPAPSHPHLPSPSRRHPLYLLACHKYLG